MIIDTVLSQIDETRFPNLKRSNSSKCFRTDAHMINKEYGLINENIWLAILYASQNGPSQPSTVPSRNDKNNNIVANMAIPTIDRRISTGLIICFGDLMIDLFDFVFVLATISFGGNYREYCTRHDIIFIYRHRVHFYCHYRLRSYFGIILSA